MKQHQPSKRVLFFIIVSSLLVLLACQTLMGGPVAVPTETHATDGPPTGTPIATPARDQADHTDPVVPTPHPPSTDPGRLCLGTNDFGAICLEDNEWLTYSRDTGDLRSNIVKDFALCPEKSMLALSTSNFSLYKNAEWHNYESGSWGHGAADGIACAPNGDIWIAHFGGATNFDGERWITYDALEYLSPGPNGTELVEDVAVTPSGTVWVVTSSSIARFERNEWTTYREGFGFDDRQFFSHITLDMNGTVWVSSNDGVFKFDGEIWHPYFNDDLLTAEDLAVDAEGRVWLASFSQGVFVLEDGQWRNYTRDNSELASDRVRDIAIDGQGRVWIGTKWGLNVVTEDNTWHTYRMDNTDMPDHDIEAIVVVDGGPPTLPTTREKATGSLSGKFFTSDRMPIANTRVEICVESLYHTFRGETPCATHPFSRATRTDAEGGFEFANLPPGRYVITILVNEEWLHITGEFGIAAERFQVYPEQETNLGDITLEE